MWVNMPYMDDAMGYIIALRSLQVRLYQAPWRWRQLCVECLQVATKV